MTSQTQFTADLDFKPEALGAGCREERSRCLRRERGGQYPGATRAF